MLTPSTYNAKLDSTETCDGSYAIVLPKARALSPVVIRAINIDIDASTSLVLGHMDKIQSLRATIAKELPGFKLEIVDNIAQLARALNKANGLYRTICQPPDDLSQLAVEATSTAQILLSDVRSLSLRHLIENVSLKKLEIPVGYENLAGNLNDLTVILDGCKDLPQRVTTEEELLRAKKLMARMKYVIGYRVANKDQINAAKDDLDRIYTLFIEDYTQLRRAVGYLFYGTDEGEKYVPSLYAKSKRSGKAEEDQATDENEPEPVEPVVTKPRSPNSPQDNPFLT